MNLKPKQKRGNLKMNSQQTFEIVKAFAYGETAEQIADAEGIDVETVREMEKSFAAEIKEEREMLRKVGYIE